VARHGDDDHDLGNRFIHRRVQLDHREPRPEQAHVDRSRTVPLHLEFDPTRIAAATFASVQITASSAGRPPAHFGRAGRRWSKKTFAGIKGTSRAVPRTTIGGTECPVTASTFDRQDRPGTFRATWIPWVDPSEP
jgi:hypothetical protein